MPTSVRLARWLFRAVVLVASVLLAWRASYTYDAGPLLLGMSTTLLLSLLVSPLIAWARFGWPLKPPSGLEFMVSGFGMPGPLMIGVLEAAVFFVAFAQGAWALVGGWLVFKAVSKWASWQHVMKLPDVIRDDEEWNLEYLRFRWAWSSQQLVSFLFGTLANIVVAGAGFLLAQEV